MPGHGSNAGIGGIFMAAQAQCGCDISRFVDGIRRFQSQHYQEQPELMRRLVDDGQAPSVLMICCSDSRVDPALLTGASPGDLFVLRNVANLVPPYDPAAAMHGTGAAIEYAVRDLKVSNVVVLGHAHCGGIKALLNAAGGVWPDRDFIGSWVGMALKACDHHVRDENGNVRKVSLDLLKQNADLVERASVMGSLDNLLTYPWLKDRVDAGNLTLHGWWFDLDTGDVWITEPDRMTMLPVV